MFKVSYNQALNAVIVEFAGKVDASQAEAFYSDIQKAIPKHGKGFKILTDLSGVQMMDPDTRGPIKKAMDFFNEHGVTEVIRVITDPSHDIGFNIMSLFHYSSKVKFLTVQSREEAEARLAEENA